MDEDERKEKMMRDLMADYKKAMGGKGCSSDILMQMMMGGGNTIEKKNGGHKEER
jgi:hypothetical protein